MHAVLGNASSLWLPLDVSVSPGGSRHCVRGLILYPWLAWSLSKEYWGTGWKL